MSPPQEPSRPNALARITAWALSVRPVRAFLHYSEHRGPMLADSVTYRTLFSVFAGVLLGFSIAALWLAGNPQAWRALIDALDAAIPGLVGSIVDPDEIPALGGFTIAGIFSLVGLIGAAIGAIGAMRTALRTLADLVHDDVLWIWVYLRNLALAAVIGAALVAAAAGMVFADLGIGVLTRLIGLSDDDPLAVAAARIGSILVVFLLDSVVVLVLFRSLSGVRADKRTLLVGAAIGGVGLTVLQQLSTWFIGGASSNPLLTTFAALIALLLWLNLSTQVILIASSYMIVSVQEKSDRVRVRYGAPTMVLRRVRRAEDAVKVATLELQNARADADAQAAPKPDQRA